MRWSMLLLVPVCISTAAGCVSLKEYKAMLAEAESSKAALAESSASFAVCEKRVSTEVAALEQERERLTKEFLTAQNEGTRLRTELESARYHLGNEEQRRQETERVLEKLRNDYGELELRSNDLRWQRDLLQTKIDTLARWDSRLEPDAEIHLAMLEQEHTILSNELMAAQSNALAVSKALEHTRQDLATERKSRQEADERVAVLDDKAQGLERLGTEIRRERDGLRDKVEDLDAKLKKTEKSRKRALVRIAQLEREKKDVAAALAKARKQADMLKASLAAEQETWVGLKEALKKMEQPATPGSPKQPPLSTAPAQR